MIKKKLNFKIFFYIIFFLIILFLLPSNLFANQNTDPNHWISFLSNFSFYTNDIIDLNNIVNSFSLSNANIGIRFDASFFNKKYGIMNNIFFGDIIFPSFYYKSISLEGYNYDWYLNFKNEFYLGYILFSFIKKNWSMPSKFGIYITFGQAFKIHLTNEIVYTYDEATSSLVPSLNYDNNNNSLMAMSLFSNVGLNYTLKIGSLTLMIDFKYLLGNLPSIANQYPIIEIPEFEIGLSFGFSIIN